MFTIFVDPDTVVPYDAPNTKKNFKPGGEEFLGAQTWDEYEKLRKIQEEQYEADLKRRADAGDPHAQLEWEAIYA